MTGDERVPAADVLRGMRLHPLPDGWSPVSAIALIRCVDQDGDAVWAFRTTPGLDEEELLGALTVRTDLLRKELLEAYSGDDSDE
ncbi:MAG: hypothetical protein ABR520_10750 [Mycobacteriales bacterium]|nr:hypothetical protein [Frankia sp.]